MERNNSGRKAGTSSGYMWLCAMSYRKAPELFQGLTAGDVAEQLGFDYLAFEQTLARVDDVLAQRSPANNRALEIGDGMNAQNRRELPAQPPPASQLPAKKSTVGKWIHVTSRIELDPILQPGDWAYVEFGVSIYERDLVRVELAEGKVLWRMVSYHPTSRDSTRDSWGFKNGKHRGLTHYKVERVKCVGRITALHRFRRDPENPLITDPWANLEAPEGYRLARPWIPNPQPV